jgi:hypothetical protein
MLIKVSNLSALLLLTHQQNRIINKSCNSFPKLWNPSRDFKA